MSKVMRHKCAVITAAALWLAVCSSNGAQRFSLVAGGTGAGTLNAPGLVAGDRIAEVIDLDGGPVGLRATGTTSCTGTNNDLVFQARYSGTAGNNISVRYVAGASLGATVTSGSIVTVSLARAAAARATGTTALSGSNNDLGFRAVNSGTGGNEISVVYYTPAVAGPLAVGVSGSTVTVFLQSTGTSTVSTSADVLAALRANTSASRLVTPANATGNDGSGLVASATTQLSGGTVSGAVSSTAAEVKGALVTSAASVLDVSIPAGDSGAGLVTTGTTALSGGTMGPFEASVSGPGAIVQTGTADLSAKRYLLITR
jgi:hypothetical protein